MTYQSQADASLCHWSVTTLRVGLQPSSGQRDTGGSLPETAERDFPLYKKQMMKKSPGPAPFLLALDPVIGRWEAG